MSTVQFHGDLSAEFGVKSGVKLARRRRKPSPPCISINGELEVVHQFQYLGSTASDTLSLDTEINKRMEKAFTILSKLTKRVWENKHVTQTKMSVNKAFIISTLLYGSKSWINYSLQERKLQVLRCLPRILRISWQDRVCNNEVLARADLPSMYDLLHQKRLRWLGHVHRMDDGRIPKDLVYGELATFPEREAESALDRARGMSASAT
ncbi:uncharacterized protein LOC134773974 [Penaeus indicus]|uniref:uncharacterized protein LOC134773974 n=1 Tax=Penaeus indicus TaxID=29960 RepID=UPI00300CBB53